MIRDLLINLDSQQKSLIKSEEISKLDHVGKFVKDNIEVEILSLEKTEINGQYGVEIFAKAWRDGKQLGFGPDGSIEIERFRIFNPPILVPDPNGDIVREWVDSHTGETIQRTLREDPIEAIRQSLAHTISIVGKEDGKIEIGKIGTTTSTYYPNAGTGSAPVDGYTTRSVSQEVFGTIQAGAGNFGSDIVASDGPYLGAGTSTDNYTDLQRSGYGFPTTDLTGESISSATFSLWSVSRLTNLGSTDVDLVSFTPISESAFSGTGGDYVSSKWGTTLFATSLALSGITDGAYNDWTLNATGIAAINKSTNTFFGTRFKWDTDNNSALITWSNSAVTKLNASFADTAGTTQDPKLVVTHAAAGGANHWLLTGI